MSSQALTASYSSPTSSPFTLSSALPSGSTSSIADKTAYLVSLRAAIASTQEQVNKQLTTRMEEDKARDANGAEAVEEAKEEENYGEEVQEEED